MNSAIIVAAGSGIRFGGDIPKQFRKLAGKGVLERTLLQFEKCKLIDEIIVVCRASEIGVIRKLILDSGFQTPTKTVEGGEHRAVSVKNGFDALDRNANIVVVHDGVRPLVTGDEIVRTIEAAKEFGAACLVAEITDTIKRVQDETVVETVDRQFLRAALTPQVFQVEILQKAFAKADCVAAATDESKLVEASGVAVKTVLGKRTNIKITREEDLAIAEALIAGGYV